jgi:hypothetical protein
MFGSLGANKARAQWDLITALRLSDLYKIRTLESASDHGNRVTHGTAMH